MKYQVCVIKDGGADGVVKIMVPPYEGGMSFDAYIHDVGTQMQVIVDQLGTAFQSATLGVPNKEVADRLGPYFPNASRQGLPVGELMAELGVTKK
jgi:hypothetical protein